MPRLATLFMRFFLPSALAVGAGIAAFGIEEAAREHDRLAIGETLDVERGARALDNRLEYVSRDLTMLSGLASLRRALDDPAERNLAAVAADFMNVSRSRQTYDQVRWLDETGKEVVRVDLVDGKPVVVPKGKLQDKGKRYYFIESVGLKPGAVFVSPFDLNVERGRIEVPFKPMIRVATPVANGQGEKRGIVILNFLGSTMLDAFHTATPGSMSHTMLVNAESYYLHHQEPELEWGFMFNRQDARLALHARAAWSRIQAENTGQLDLDDGLWTWRTVFPLDIGQRAASGTTVADSPDPRKVDRASHTWKVVSHHPKEQRSLVMGDAWLRIGLVAAILFAVLAFGSYKLALAWYARETAEAEVRRINSGLETTIEDRTRHLMLAAKAIEGTAEGVMVTDGAHRIIEINPALERITGRSRTELIGKLPDVLLPPGKQRRERDTEIVTALEREGRWHGELELLHADGSLRTCLIAISHIELGSGQQDNYVTLLTDISDRKRAEDELRKLSLAVEQSAESIVITNLEAKIEYVNDAFVRTSGYPRDEVIGQNPRVLRSGKTPASTYAALWSSLKDGRSWRGELINRRKDGSEFVERVIISPIRDAGGRITHYLGVKEDITEYKRIAEELDRHRNHLEALVEERTTALSIAKESAESASRAKSALLANMSHELRTPMNAIMGMTNLVRRKLSDPNLVRRLETVEDAARQLLEVINDLLDISNLEAERFSLQNIAFTIDEVIGGVTARIEPLAHARGLVYRSEIAADLSEIQLLGDPARLGQILLNLTSNAIKFTDRGTVDLRVSLTQEDARRVRLRCEVEDTGIGIPAADMARLFSPFEQGDMSSTRRHGGTGLGLAICQRLAHMMDGELSVASSPGQGSRFTLTVLLPLAGSDAT